MKTLLTFTFLIFWVMNSHAESFCGTLLVDRDESLTLEYSQKRPLTFTNTEVFRRNNHMGQQQVGEIRLEKWFELPPYDQGYYNFIGVSADGKIYHIVDWEGKRRIARLLGGQRQFTDLALVNGEILVALDLEGKVFIYSPDLWSKSPRNKIIAQALLISGGIFSFMTTSFYMATPETFTPELAPLILGTTGVLSVMQSSFWGLFKYDRLNTYPDGFTKTTWTVEQMSDLEFYAEEIAQLARRQTHLTNAMSPTPLETISQLPQEATEDIR